MKKNEKTRKQSRRGRWRLRPWKLAASLGVLTLGWFVFGVSGCAESMLMYHPSRRGFATPAQFEDVAFQTEDGLTLHGWFMPALTGSTDGPSPAVLHIHGNAGNISSHVGFSEFLPAAGVSVLIFDYRSFGRSDRARGRLNRSHLLTDAHAALDYLLSRPDVDPDQVSVLGVSLGGVIGLSLAAERDEVKRVVSVSAFASWNQIASDHLGLLGRMIAARGLDAEDAASQLGQRELMVMHGQDDPIVSAKHASIIADAAKSAGVPTLLMLVPGREHNDMLMAGSSEAEAIATFLLRGLQSP